MTTVSSQAATLDYQLLTTVALGGSDQGLSGSYTNTVHEVWYLFGYPTVAIQNADTIVGIEATAAGGVTFPGVTVFAAQRFAAAPLVQQPGFWTLAAIPTIVTTTGILALAPNLVTDGFWRFILDFNTDQVIKSKFNQASRLQIFNGSLLIYDGSPLEGPFSPINIVPANPSAYTAQGVHFDGQTGLVIATPLVSPNLPLISFAGWFNFDTSLSGQLEFSSGQGSNSLFLDRSIPTPGAWCHVMGTIDANQNVATLLSNGQPVNYTTNTIGSSFNFIPTNGTNVYIGTDNQGNFFKGDIADLSIWFDTSWVTNGVIPGNIIGRIVDIQVSGTGITTIQPKNPALSLFGFTVKQQPFQQTPTNVITVRLPDIFLSGPANSALTPHLATGAIVDGVNSLKMVSGALTNSSTNPGSIAIYPTI